MNAIKIKRKKSLNSSVSPDSPTQTEISNPPTHVAIIMDGNGRWAKKHRLTRNQGHEKGSNAVRSVIRASREIGIAHLTLYAFSTENWQRPKKEIDALMLLLKRFLKSEQKEMQENNIRLNVIGQVDRLRQDVQRQLHKVMKATEDNTALNLHLALSYGGRAEIVQMVQTLLKKCLAEQASPDAIDEQRITENLYTHGIPDPDLLIRTSGEMRISNFLLWQIAYTELFITKTLWPDFGKEEFLQILKDYQSRERRFGKT
jgi:undecaprenyl diphosphate synthase